MMYCNASNNQCKGKTKLIQRKQYKTDTEKAIHDTEYYLFLARNPDEIRGMYLSLTGCFLDTPIAPVGHNLEPPLRESFSAKCLDT